MERSTAMQDNLADLQDKITKACTDVASNPDAAGINLLDNLYKEQYDVHQALLKVKCGKVLRNSRWL